MLLFLKSKNSDLLMRTQFRAGQAKPEPRMIHYFSRNFTLSADFLSGAAKNELCFVRGKKSVLSRSTVHVGRYILVQGVYVGTA
jgi:hypothetical protein